MKRIKWLNVMKLILLVFSIVMILKDLYYITWYSWEREIITTWTWYGFITFFIYVSIVGAVIEDILEKTQATGTSSRPRYTKV
jgi:hypothetical protein